MIAKNLHTVLEWLGGEPNLSDENKELASRTVETMEHRFGYDRTCTSECASHLLRHTYAKDLDR